MIILLILFYMGVYVKVYECVVNFFLCFMKSNVIIKEKSIMYYFYEILKIKC